MSVKSIDGSRFGLGACQMFLNMVYKLLYRGIYNRYDGHLTEFHGVDVTLGR